MEPETRRAFLLLSAELEADGMARSARLGRELAGVAERRLLGFRVSFLWGVVVVVLLVAAAIVWFDVARDWVGDPVPVEELRQRPNERAREGAGTRAEVAPAEERGEPVALRREQERIVERVEEADHTGLLIGSEATGRRGRVVLDGHENTNGPRASMGSS